jgi:hypothetical protein
MYVIADFLMRDRKRNHYIYIISPVLVKQLLLWLHKNDNKNNNNTNTIVHYSRDNNAFDLTIYIYICEHWAYIQIEEKTINSLKLLIRTPHANVWYVCHMHISNMIDRSITSCDIEK